MQSLIWLTLAELAPTLINSNLKPNVHHFLKKKKKEIVKGGEMMTFSKDPCKTSVALFYFFFKCKKLQ